MVEHAPQPVLRAHPEDADEHDHEQRELACKVDNHRVSLKHRVRDNTDLQDGIPFRVCLSRRGEGESVDFVPLSIDGLVLTLVTPRYVNLEQAWI